MYLARGDVAGARRALERGVELAPDHAILHLTSRSRRRGRRRAATRAHLERAVALDPLLVAAYGPLAELELRAGEVDRAIAHLARRVELDPGSAVAHTDLASVLQAVGREAEAVARCAPRCGSIPGSHPPRSASRGSSPRRRIRRFAAARSAGGRQRLCAAGCAEPERLAALAAAQAAAGDPAAAAATADRAIAQARAAGGEAQASILERQRESTARGARSSSRRRARDAIGHGAYGGGVPPAEACIPAKTSSWCSIAATEFGSLACVASASASRAVSIAVGHAARRRLGRGERGGASRLRGAWRRRARRPDGSAPDRGSAGSSFVASRNARRLLAS